jgi:hypothetical protein
MSSSDKKFKVGDVVVWENDHKAHPFFDTIEREITFVYDYSDPESDVKITPALVNGSSTINTYFLKLKCSNNKVSEFEKFYNEKA